MKFIFSRDLRDNPALRASLVLFLGLILLFLILSVFLENSTSGLFPEQIKNQILGNPELFIKAQSLENLVVESHIKLFTFLITGLSLTALLVRMPLQDKTRMSVITVVFALMLIETASVFITYFFGGSGGAWLKSISFFALIAWLGYWSLWSLVYLCSPVRNFK